MTIRTSNPYAALVLYVLVLAYAALGMVGMYEAGADHHPLLFVVQPFVPFLAPLHGLLHIVGVW